jgi:hypothetical protein
MLFFGLCSNTIREREMRNAHTRSGIVPVARFQINAGILPVPYGRLILQNAFNAVDAPRNASFRRRR